MDILSTIFAGFANIGTDDVDTVPWYCFFIARASFFAGVIWMCPLEGQVSNSEKHTGLTDRKSSFLLCYVLLAGG